MKYRLKPGHHAVQIPGVGLVRPGQLVEEAKISMLKALFEEVSEPEKAAEPEVERKVVTRPKVLEPRGRGPEGGFDEVAGFSRERDQESGEEGARVAQPPPPSMAPPLPPAEPAGSLGGLGYEDRDTKPDQPVKRKRGRPRKKRD